MNKNPQERHASCLEFLEALGQARDDEDVPAPRNATRKILIVDDDPGIRTIYTTALKVGLPDAMILTAEDGMTAMEMVKASQPDLILLDMEMPRMNGLEVCAALTGDEMTAAIPLVVLSARTQEDTRSLLKSMGVRNVLRKPVELTHLVDVAKRCLKESKRR